MPLRQGTALPYGGPGTHRDGGAAMARSMKWGITLSVSTALLLVMIFGASLLHQPAAAQGTRTIYMAAVEPKGGTGVSSEPFPTASLSGGGGYVLNTPHFTAPS